MIPMNSTHKVGTVTESGYLAIASSEVDKSRSLDYGTK